MKEFTLTDEGSYWETADEKKLLEQFKKYISAPDLFFEILNCLYFYKNTVYTYPFLLLITTFNAGQKLFSKLTTSSKSRLAVSLRSFSCFEITERVEHIEVVVPSVKNTHVYFSRYFVNCSLLFKITGSPLAAYSYILLEAVACV